MLRVVLIVCSFVFVGCGGNDSENRTDEGANNFNYRPITQADLEAVEAIWLTRDLKPSGTELILEESFNATHDLKLFSHTVNGNLHYGAVFIPKNSENQNLPVTVIPYYLNQADPVIGLAGYMNWHFDLYPEIVASIIVLPSLRGQSIRYSENLYQSSGDFCDAYDGASDDTIAFMNVVEAEIPQADFSNVVAMGGSRGGIISHIIAHRDPRVDLAIATAGPTDFYDQTLWDKYGEQYYCQFIENKTEEESRLRMLSSSPALFSTDSQRTIIHHGILDDVVDVTQAEAMFDRLAAQGKQVEIYTYLRGHGDIYHDELHLERTNAELSAFYQQALAAANPR